MRRLIFTLLYDRGQFMLSRNFRLQRVGDVKWLFDNYDFASVSRALDELMVIDVSRGSRDPKAFADSLMHIAERCFIPLTAGGGITTSDIARRYLHSGADKLLINSSFRRDPAFCRSLADQYGRQCIVAGIDYRRLPGTDPVVMTDNGMHEVGTTLSDWVGWVEQNGAGEILLQSMDQDGTGMGMDLSICTALSRYARVPCILMGGIGRAEHVIAGLKQENVDAVATANLFNFIGSAILDARKAILAAGVEVAQWDEGDYALLRGRFANPT